MVALYREQPRCHGSAMLCSLLFQRSGSQWAPVLVWVQLFGSRGCCPVATLHSQLHPQSLLCTLRPRLCNQRLKVRGTYWIKQFIHSPLSVIRQIAMESVYPGAAPKETHPRCRTARGETSSPPLRSFHSPRNTNMPSPCPPEYCRRFNWQSDRKAQKLCKLSRNERKGEKKEGEDFITVSGKNYWSLNFCTPLWDNGLWVCMQFIKCRKKQQLVSPTSVSCGSSQESKIKISARSVLFPQYLLGDRQCY